MKLSSIQVKMQQGREFAFPEGRELVSESNTASKGVRKHEKPCGTCG